MTNARARATRWRSPPDSDSGRLPSSGDKASRPIHIVTPFDVPPAATIIDLETFAARDFTPERAADLNVYDKVADHLSDERRKGRRTIIASYSEGSRSRLLGLLKDHGLARMALAGSWQEALGQAATGMASMVVLPQDHGFATETGVILFSIHHTTKPKPKAEKAEKADAPAKKAPAKKAAAKK